MPKRLEFHSDEIRKLYAPFLADSDVDGGVAQDVNGFGTDLLLGTLPPPAAPPVALLLAGTFTGETGGVFLGILVVAPPDPTFLVGDSPTGCCVFSSTPLSWSPSANINFLKIIYSSRIKIYIHIKSMTRVWLHFINNIF